MKSEHRHELKTNELAEWLGNLPEWFRENLITLIVLVIAIAIFAGFLAWRFHSRNVQSGEHIQFTNMLDSITGIKAQIIRQQSNDMSYLLLTQAKELQNFAAAAQNDNISAFAYVKGADSIRSELHYSLDTVSKDYLTDQINKAKSIYTQAVEKYPSNKTIKGLATFGLGLCAEELGNFDEARNVYSGIVENTDFAGTILVNKANLRLNTIDSYEKPIVFQSQPSAPLPEPNVVLQPLRDFITGAPNQPAETNVPSDMNTPAGTSIGNTGSEVNVPEGIILPGDQNLPGDSESMSETNLPAETNPPIEENLPIDVNTQE
jgi:predicted negative regulator of RcsB-dependent stress response